MSKIGDARIVILFKDELLAASVALRQFDEAVAEKADDETYRRLLQTALQACYGALYHLSEPSELPLMVTVSESSLFKPRKGGKSK